MYRIVFLIFLSDKKLWLQSWRTAKKIRKQKVCIEPTPFCLTGGRKKLCQQNKQSDSSAFSPAVSKMQLYYDGPFFTQNSCLLLHCILLKKVYWCTRFDFTCFLSHFSNLIFSQFWHLLWQFLYKFEHFRLLLIS